MVCGEFIFDMNESLESHQHNLVYIMYSETSLCVHLRKVGDLKKSANKRYIGTQRFHF
jgi:hypothetical protein